MCLYPVLGRNKKYEPNKKNAGKVPAFFDDRVLHVPRACGNCIECKKAKARDWQLRLTEEIKAQTNCGGVRHLRQSACIVRHAKPAESKSE